jgi:hypothetical protein
MAMTTRFSTFMSETTGTANMKTRWTWTKIAAALAKRNELGVYLSYDDYGNRVLRCNNGWIQARTPTQASYFVK